MIKGFGQAGFLQKRLLSFFKYNLSMHKIIFIAWFAFSSINGFAQVENFATDQPGKTNTPSTVLKKYFQFETSFLREMQSTSPYTKNVYVQHPTLFIKYGLGNRFELRIVTELATIKEEYVNGDVNYSGINSAQLGGKFNFLKAKGLRPQISIIAHYDFRGLHTIYGAGDTIDGANFKLAFQHNLSESFFLSYNLGMQWERFSSSITYVYSISPKFIFNEKWLAFVEFYGFAWKDTNPENSMDGGLAYTINQNLRIDVSAGFGINKKAPNFTYGIGASFRFKAGK